MVSGAFIAEHWISLIFGLISTGAVAYCSFLYKRFKQYEAMQEEKNREEIEALIDERVKPFIQMHGETIHHFTAIRDSYKYRLIELCKMYLERGSITTKEYDQLSEMWKVYHELGGNSQAEDYYYRAEELPIKD